MGRGQPTQKKIISREEWEKKLARVHVKKSDMNKLVMNFLVTEGYVEAAEIFQKESGTDRIPPKIYETAPLKCYLTYF